MDSELVDNEQESNFEIDDEEFEVCLNEIEEDLKKAR